MEFVGLKKHIASRQLSPCYYCYGDDEYVIARSVALFKSVASEPIAFNVSDKEFSSSNELWEELAQLPLTGDKRVVVARGKFDMETVEKYLSSPNPSTVLVLVSHIPHDTWGKAQSFVVPNGITGVDCNRQGEALLVKYVQSIFSKTNTTASDRAIRTLCLRCDRYMTRINSEAKRLALLCAGGEVTEEIVIREVKADMEFVVFELTDAIIKRNTAHALAVVDGMAKNNDLVAAFTMLYNRFKKLFAVSVDPNGVADSGVKPYMLNKLRDEASRFSKVRLKRNLDLLADADFAYKTGVATQYDALCSFVVQATSEV